MVAILTVVPVLLLGECRQGFVPVRSLTAVQVSLSETRTDLL